MPGQFLIKDVVLIGVSVLTLVDSIGAVVHGTARSPE